MLACTNSQQKVRFISDKEEYILWKKKAGRMVGDNKEELEGEEYGAWKARIVDGESGESFHNTCAWSRPGCVH